ncbi:MAG: hypothetical protein J5819_07740, partial [Eubacterium sp.]|nr:hypothetical protein [Eubacterium sp.]
IQFFDGTRSEGANSLFEGYSVGWKTIPKKITDKKNCTVKLNNSGEGELEFNNYAFLAYGFEPVVVLYDKNGRAVDEFKFEWTMEGARVDIGKESLKLSPATQTIKMGEKGSVKVKGINIGKVSFASGDEKIAKIGAVDKDTVTIEGVGPGTTTITATAGELSDSVQVTVVEDTVALSPAEVTLTDTKTKQTVFLKHIVNGEEKNIKITNWNVTDDGKILATTKNSDGSITVSASGKGSGTATISCTYNKETYTCTVTVALPEITVSLNTTEIKITDTTTAHELYLQQKVGEITEKIKDIKWNISAANKDFLNATTKDGTLILYGKGDTGGTATITCSYDGKTYSCTVTVAFAVAAYLDNTSITINDPDYVPTINLMETGSDGKALKVKTKLSDWKVTDTGVLSIKESGTGGIFVTGLKAGTATITITYKGQTFTCSVTVTFGTYFLNNTSIKLTSPNDGVGILLEMEKDGQTSVVQTEVGEWNNSDPGVVKLEASSSGGVMCFGLKNGTSTISITYGGVSYKCVVTVSFSAATPTPFPTSTPQPSSGTVDVYVKGSTGTNLTIREANGSQAGAYPTATFSLIDRSTNRRIPISNASFSAGSGVEISEKTVETGADASGTYKAKVFKFTRTGTCTVNMTYKGVTYRLHFTIDSGPTLHWGILQYYVGDTDAPMSVF